jgi:hypothetical protein
MFERYHEAEKKRNDKTVTLSDVCNTLSVAIANDSIDRPLDTTFSHLSQLSKAAGSRFDAGLQSFALWMDHKFNSFNLPNLLSWKSASDIIKNLPATFQWKLQLDLQGDGKRAHFFPAAHKAEILPMDGGMAGNIAEKMESEGFVTFVYAMDDGIGRRIMWMDCEGQLSINGIVGYRQGSVEQIFRVKK